MESKNALICLGGGPSPVINASLQGVIERCFDYPDKIAHVYCAHHGIEGVLLEELMDMKEEDPAELPRLRNTPASGAIGTISAEGSHVSYVNHRDTPDDTPETGDSTRTLLWLTLCLASLGGAILLIVTKPRRRGKRIQ